MIKRKNNYRTFYFELLAILLVGIASPLHAFDFNWTAGSGSWTNGSNWDQGGFLPDVFDEGVGVIGSTAGGATQVGGIATLSGAAPDSAGLVLGREEGTNGTFRVLSGGSINFLESTGEPIGAANIGLDGQGVLEVHGGGSLSTTSLDINVGSLVEIGSGSGVASVISTDTIYINGTIHTHGPGHVFTSAQYVEFENQSRYIVDLQATTHTTLASLGEARIYDGVLAVTTSGGFSPSTGDSWDILTGATITGQDFSLDTMASPPEAGHAYRTQVIAGGNGQLMQLVYDNFATLKVNASTGAVSMVNESGTPIDITGYSVLSQDGSLNPSNWTSLTDQAVSGWEEAGVPSAQSVNELNSQSSLSLTGSTIQLGNLLTLPQAFGDAPSDIDFEYVTDGATEAVRGIVELTGTAAANNLLLTVNPTTGEGQLQNSSNFSVDLLGYSILSEAGSLDDSNWTSLESQLIGDWDEAAPSANALSELISDGSATLFPGEAFSLGQMFLLGESRDLQLEFLLSANGTEEIRQGVVQYGAIVEVIGLPGDYNGDGSVDAADYTVWRDNLGGSGLLNEGDGISPGVVDVADYNFWVSQYGTTSSLSATASVPEAASIVQLILGCVLAASKRRRNIG